MIFGGQLGWLPWQRPGYDLGLKLEALATSQPNLKGIILEGHGRCTWGETAKSCYEITLEMIRLAEQWLNENIKQPVFGGVKTITLPAEQRAGITSMSAGSGRDLRMRYDHEGTEVIVLFGSPADAARKFEAAPALMVTGLVGSIDNDLVNDFRYPGGTPEVTATKGATQPFSR